MNEFEDFKKEKLSIDLVWANVFILLLMIPILLIYGLPFFFIWKSELNIHEIIKEFIENHIFIKVVLLFFIKFALLFVIGTIAHELIHGIVFAIFAKKGFKSIKFGVLWKMLTPYCHCKEPLKVKHYILGAIAPAIILGIIPAITALFTGSIWLLFFGMIFTLAAGGDFLTINLLRKEKPDDYVEDHPSEVGCFIYRK